MSFTDRLMHAWNAFRNKDPSSFHVDYGAATYSARPDRTRMTRGNEKSIVTALYNRIAVDISAMDIKHVRLDEQDRYLNDMDSDFNECLTVSANLDQSGRAFIQDLVLSLFDEGCVAVVPVETTFNPIVGNSYDIQQLRVGRIVTWQPEFVTINIYNEKTAQKEDIVLPKKMVAIIENPFYAVMNERNSVVQRLVHKLNLLDVIDEQSGAGKLDLIIQLPYVIKTEARRKQAEMRRKEIETQLANSKYGIAYTDGTEHVTQLNRSLENNLMTQIEYLTKMVYSQLGIDETILLGTANDQTLLNYQNNVLEPVIAAICNEFTRKFLTKTARTQKQCVKFFFDPFKIIPTSQISEIADKFTRNEIMTSNEVRQLIGLKPSDDPSADELRNKNLNQSAEAMAEEQTGDMQIGEEEAGVDTTDPEALRAQYEEQLRQLEEADKKLEEMERRLNE